MVVNDLRNKTIFLDTAPLIYYIEGNSTYQQVLKTIFNANDLGDFTFITSTITLLEVLVVPYRSGKPEIANQYKRLLQNSNHIYIIDLNEKISTLAAKIRADYNIKTPDSIQIATAKEHKSDYFLTNDLKLKSLGILDILLISEISL